MTEFFFTDENGNPTISEERVKTLFYEFTSVMKAVHTNIAKKYGDIVATIIIEPDLDGIDFPLIAEKLKIEGLKSLLSPELAEKLDLSEEFNFDSMIDDSLRISEKEELKESEYQ